LVIGGGGGGSILFNFVTTLSRQLSEFYYVPVIYVLSVQYRCDLKWSMFNGQCGRNNICALFVRQNNQSVPILAGTIRSTGATHLVFDVDQLI